MPLVRLDPRIRDVVPVALRRWRAELSPGKAWREFGAFRLALRRETYTAILDLQEQVKGAVVARIARGTRHGLDRHSIREPLATLFDDVHHRIARDQHFIDKCRALAAAALGYAVSGPPRWQFAPPATTAAMPAAPLRARVPRDEPRRQAVARRPLARDPRPVRERRHRDAAAVGQPARAGAQPAARRGRRDGDRAAAADAARNSRRSRAMPKRSSASTPASRTLPPRSARRPSRCSRRPTPRWRASRGRVPHAIDVGGNGTVPAFDDVAAALGRVLRDAPRC